MKNSKTFRLFISSTFEDFRRERALLQTKVFPHIKDYCTKYGYTFQPIDLRWGVSNEAQLDQKTLELCLNEVRSCKSYSYPNFLVMIGDRYGWIPLPYIIPKREFEELCTLMTTEEVAKMANWYQEDLNQIPVSYILNERRATFESFEIWQAVEEDLKSIFQKVASNSKLNIDQKRKYFLSATEAEVEEGIIPYFDQTFYQKGLLGESPELLDKDAKNIFGFFRDIDIKTKKSDKFITADYKLAQNFKDKVKSELSEKNILHSRTRQTTEIDLEENYLTQFVERTIAFLESKIDEQQNQQKENNISSLEFEIEAQNYFAKQKRQNFIGQAALLSSIENYLSNDNQQALIISGASGKGKSALIAKAIEQAKAAGEKKILFRFVGATAQSDTTTNILTSLFSEMGIDVNFGKDNKEHQKSDQEITPQNIEEKTETFEDFSYRMADQILKIDEEVIIFLDAIDQLSNEDPFIWLPKKLPSNVKIIISALSDKKYQEDSKYFEKLKTKTQNLRSIESFEAPVKLLKKILEQENRTIQKHQEVYFLAEFKKYNSPFFVFVVAQEMKHWKSFDLVPGQAVSQKGRMQKLTNNHGDVISKFIENLSSIYHHEKGMVEKVLAYIFASRDGLSESELLELLSIDEDFVQEMAPSTWHENLNKDLPLVIWTRLYTSLKPFLSLKLQDGAELMYFFHREFADAIRSFVNQKDEHEQIIIATQKLVEKYQFDDFENNRWGKLFQITEIGFHETYHDLKNTDKFVIKIAALDSTVWKNAYLEYISWKAVDQNKSNKVRKAIYNATNSNIIAKILFRENNEKWLNLYAASLGNLGLFNSKINNYQAAIEFNRIAMNLLKSKAESDPVVMKSYITCLGNNAALLKELNKLDEALKTYEELFEILNFKINNEPTIFIFNKTLFSLLNMIGLLIKRKGENDLNEAEQLAIVVIQKTGNLLEEDDTYVQIFSKAMIHLGVIYSGQGRIKEAKELEEELTEFIESRRKISHGETSEDEIISKINLMGSYASSKNFLKAKELGIGLVPVLQKLLKVNRRRWIEWEYRLLGSLGIAYGGLGQEELACEYTEKSLQVIIELYSENQEKWQVEYLRTLVNFSWELKERKEIEKGIVYLKNGLEVVKPLFVENQFQWGEIYLTILGNLGDMLSLSGNDSGGLRKEQMAFDVAKDLFAKDPERWGGIYTNIMINMTATLYKMDFGPDPIIDLLKQAYEIIKPLFQENPEFWGERFVHCLKNLVNFYRIYKYAEEEIITRKELLEVSEMLCGLSLEQFGKTYSTELIGNFMVSFRESKINEALKYGKRALSVCEKGLDISPDNWNGQYIDVLYLLGKINYQIQNIQKGLEYLEEGSSYLRNLYTEDIIWKDNLIKFLSSLSSIYQETGNHNKAKECDRILRFVNKD